jgi:hypothetical protein
MGDCTCTKEKEIGELSANVSMLCKKINGNGRPGLDTTIPLLSQQIQTLSEAMEALTPKIEEVLAFKNKYIGIDEYKEKEGFTKREKTGLWITAIIGISAIVVSIIFKI